MQAAAEWFVRLLGFYATLGTLFAIAFVSVGVGRIDRVAKVSTPGFRIVILPGVAALWPFLLTRWIRGGDRE